MTDLPEPNECWQAPPAQPAGDADPASIYLAVGAASSHWESVESGFATLLAALLESDSPAARKLFCAFHGNPSRREALNGSARIFFRRHAVTLDDQEEFETLMEHYRLACVRSDEIVHGVAAELDGGGSGYFLRPPEYRSKAADAEARVPGRNAAEPGDYRYASQDIAQFASKFHNFRLAIVRYIGDIAGKYGGTATGS